MGDQSASSRPWTALSRGAASNASDTLQSSSSSIRSLRNRSSFFFGRSRSNASKARLNQQPPSPPESQDPEPSRPPTAHSNHTARSKTESLHAIRETLLGGRRRAPHPPSHPGDESIPSLRSTRNESTSSVSAPNPDRGFQSGEQYYNHLRKSSISPPFNFQHVAHTAKQQLPPLETVQEHDLTREFWSVSSRQRPRRHLHGISANDLPKHQYKSDPTRPSTSIARPVSPLTPSELGDDSPPHIETPVEPIPSLDDAMFDKLNQSSAKRVDSVRTPLRDRRNAAYPRRHSSMNALNNAEYQTPSSQNYGPTFYESDSSNNNSGGNTTPEAVPTASTHSATFALPPPNVTTPVESPDPDDIDYRSRQPLPPVPKSPPMTSGRPRKSSIKSLNTTNASSASLHPPSKQATSPKSKRSSRHSSRSSRSAGLSVCHSSLLDMRQSINISDTTWEDDVDFIYEQEAESTCDFNWEIGKNTRPRSVKDASENRPTSVAYHAHSRIMPFDEVHDTPANDSRETIAERRQSRKVDLAPRASSVGHRGFLAARRSSQELRDMATPIHLTPNSSHASLLSPVFSINGAQQQMEEEETLSKPPFPQPTLQYPHLHRTSPDFLSDPESHRTSLSTQHRKSSSYSSHESRPRPPPARDTHRWSLLSTTSASLPELTPSTRARHSKILLSKNLISKPLEALPQSPPADFDGEDSPIVPREFQTQPVRNSFVMRRPQTPSDRAVLQAAGRSAQERGMGGHRREYSVVSSAGLDGGGWI